MARRTHRPWPAATVAVALLLLAACGVTAKDDHVSAGGGEIQGGVESPDGPTSTTQPRDVELLPPIELEVQGKDDNPLNTVATTAIADLEKFWEKEFPAVYGEPYTPLQGGLFAYDSGTDSQSLPCATDDIQQMMMNAFYCPPADAVAWDQELLVPQLAADYGEFTVAVVLAHEWGHVIQGRLDDDAPSVYVELQADCFAGAWVGHVNKAEKTHFMVDAAVLDQALAGVLFLKDAPGTTADDPMAHGSGFDRVGAFQDGYLNSASACKDYLDAGFTPFQFPFTTQSDFDNEGNLPLEGEGGIQDQGVDAVEAYWAATFPEISGGEAWTPLEEPVVFDRDDPPSCNGKVVDQFRLFYCQPERWVGYTDDVAAEAYERDGDFGFAVLLGTQYGLAVQDALGDIPDDVVVMTLRGDCYAGAWAGAIVPDENGNVPDDFVLQLSPGDLDEAVSALLGIRSESDRLRQGPAFNRVSAFRTGVIEGAAACSEVGA